MATDQPAKRRRGSAPSIHLPEPITAEEKETHLHRRRVSGSTIFLMVKSWYAVGKINAADFTQFCYFADLAELLGASFHDYGVAPGLQTGSYSRHLDDVFRTPRMVELIESPSTSRKLGTRQTHRLSASILHEAMADAAIADPQGHTVTTDTELPPVYWEHRLVKRAREQGKGLPVPLALYTDGVRYSANTSSNPDTCLGVWACNVLTSRRHFITSIRSRRSCQCGCSGWCSIWPVLQYVKWSLCALASGERPTRRYNGEGFPDDHPLKSVNPAPLPLTAVVIRGAYATSADPLVKNKPIPIVFDVFLAGL